MTSLLAPSSPFDAPSLIYTLLTQPLKFLLRLLDYTFSILRTSPTPATPPIRIVCISDTHCLKPSSVPHGDLLIHAGDLTNAGTPAELQAQINWLNSLPHTHKIAIAGNHDTYLDARSRKTLDSKNHNGTVDWKSILYLQHANVSLRFHSGARELKIYGAPQIPACGGDEFAFQYPRGSDAWSGTIPKDTDILITHSPPKYHLDLPSALGCEHLLQEVWHVQPRVHIFGHVHAGKTDTFGSLRGGREVVRWDAAQKCAERVLARSDGFVLGFLDLRNWVDAVFAVYYGVTGLLWDRIWGGASARPTFMINAALMYDNTGKLGHEPQVIEI